MEKLTGKPTEEIHFREEDRSTGAKRDPDFDLIWAKVLSARQAEFLMGASCGGDVQPEVLKAVGLVPDHAYSVLDVVQVDADVSGCGALQLVLLRNPHGTTAWSGPWSKASPEWAGSAQMRMILEPIEASHSGGSSGGVFFVAFADFCLYFYSLTVCKVREDWVEARSRVLLPSTKPGQNLVGIRLRSLAPCAAEVVITQPGSRGLWTHETFLDPGCLVVKRSGAAGAMEIVSAARCTFRSSVQCEAVLQSHDDSGAEYLIIPYSTRALTALSSQERHMVVAIHSATPVLVDEADLHISVFQRAMLGHVRRSGKNFATHLGCSFYMLKSPSGVVLVADHCGVVAISATLTIQQTNLLSSRDAMTISDTVPAGHGQILAMLSQGSEAAGFSYSLAFEGGVALPFGGAKHTPAVLDNSIHSPFRN